MSAILSGLKKRARTKRGDNMLMPLASNPAVGDTKSEPASTPASTPATDAAPATASSAVTATAAVAATTPAMAAAGTPAVTKPAAGAFAPRDTKPSTELPAPGHWRMHDFTVAGRKTAATDADTKTAAAPAKPVSIRVVQWNIERGFEINGIVHELLRLNADILILQELDVGCGRTHAMDVPQTLARLLRMRVVFASEFVELKSPLRKLGGSIGEGGGVHGNAILTRFDILDCWSFQHRIVPFDWEAKGAAKGEPRKGRRVVLGARIRTPLADAPEVLVYSTHLENHSGMVGRYRQFMEVLTDINEKQIKFSANGKRPDTPLPVMVGGDLNTIVCGGAKLLREYFDSLSTRIFCTNITEAMFWERVLLAATKPEDLPPAVRHYFVPHDALTDPWHKANDVTLSHSFLGCTVYSAKLDWLLLSSALRNRVVSRAMGGLYFSDHKYLTLELS